MNKRRIHTFPKVNLARSKITHHKIKIKINVVYEKSLKSFTTLVTQQAKENIIKRYKMEDERKELK